MYINGNPKSKKLVKEWLKEGKRVTCFPVGLQENITNGTAFVAGPHEPDPHTWYGRVTIVNGVVTSIK